MKYQAIVIIDFTVSRDEELVAGSEALAAKNKARDIRESLKASTQCIDVEVAHLREIW